MVFDLNPLAEVWRWKGYCYAGWPVTTHGARSGGSLRRTGAAAHRFVM